MAKAESAASGLRFILVATAVAGVLGYAIQLTAPGVLTDDAAYVTFSVYWSTLYLLVSALSGVQQEVTRAASAHQDGEPASALNRFTLIVVLIVVGVVALLSLLIGPRILPGSSLFLGASLCIGVVGYVLVAVLAGVLYGLRRWREVAALTIIDAVVRAVLVVTALLVGLPAEWVALAISLPFGIAFALVWIRVRGAVVGRFRLDVKLPRLLLHTGGTVLAATAMGVIMSGLPMLLGLTVHGADTAALPATILAITVTRAPIVVPLLALQSYLISVFRGSDGILGRRLIVLIGACAAALVVLVGLAWAIGPWAIGVLSGGRFTIGSPEMAEITLSASLVAVMCITGPALLSRRRHGPYVAGWVGAAAATVIALLLPVAFDVRLPLALLAPPALGLLLHVAALSRRARPAVPGAQTDLR